jgi:hypothetical protein
MALSCSALHTERLHSLNGADVFSRFHPWSNTSGSVIIDGQVIDAKGNGMFVHAIQGMRPDSVSPLPVPHAS